MFNIVNSKAVVKKILLSVLVVSVFSSFVGLNTQNGKTKTCSFNNACYAKTLYDSNKDEGGFTQWVQNKDMWFGIKTSDGTFEKGSKFNVDILEKGSDIYNSKIKLFDGNLREKIEGDNIMLFNISVTKPNGSAYTDLKNPVDIYVEVPFDWDFYEAKTILLKEFADATFEEEVISLELEDERPHNFVKFTVSHLPSAESSFTVYDKHTVWDFVENYAWVFGIVILVIIIVATLVVKKRRKTNNSKVA